MTYPLALVICFGILVAAFLFIYIKEYRREENIMKQLPKSSYGNTIPLVLVEPPPAPKKKKATAEPTKTDKKKDLN